MSTTTVARVRQSRQVRLLRESAPYSNIWLRSSIGDHAHPFPPELRHNVESQKGSWVTYQGYGSRHVLDTAPFSLWLDTEHNFRPPSRAEFQWFKDKYLTTACNWAPPFLVLVTSSPPQPLPLSVACMPVIFLSVEAYASLGLGWSPQPRNTNSNHLADRRSKDPIPNASPIPFTKPNSSQTQEIIKALNDMISIKAISFSWPCVIVELHQNRSYEEKSLPGRVGGWLAWYHQSTESYWSVETPLARSRLMTPTVSTAGDRTDYTEGGPYCQGVLGPGIRVEGNGMSSTAGVKLRNSAGHVRVTVCNHGFKESSDNEVWHPDGNGHLIGVVKERFPDDDVALVDMQSWVKFDNGLTFDCMAPRRLLHHDDMRLGDCFYCDGMTTGGVALTYFAILMVEGFPNSFSQFKYETSNIFKAIGPIGTAELKAGMCGAAIIGDDEQVGGGLAGFFRFDAGDGNVLAPSLENIINAGWSIY